MDWSLEKAQALSVEADRAFNWKSALRHSVLDFLDQIDSKQNKSQRREYDDDFYTFVEHSKL